MKEKYLIELLVIVFVFALMVFLPSGAHGHIILTSTMEKGFKPMVMCRSALRSTGSSRERYRIFIAENGKGTWNSNGRGDKNFNRRRWKRWQSLTPEEKNRLRNRYKTWRNLPLRRKKQLRNIYRTLAKMPPEERRKLIPMIRNWRFLSREEKNYVQQKLFRYGFEMNSGEI